MISSVIAIAIKILATVATPYAVSVAHSQRARSLPRHRKNFLQQPLINFFLGLIWTVLFGGLGFGMLLIPDQRGAGWLALVAAGVAIPGLLLIADYFRSVHMVSDKGMRYGRPVRPGGHFRWSEVVHIDFSRQMNWYRVTLDCGVTVRVSGTLRGLPTFARHVLAHVPVESIDPSTHAMLIEAERGQLHSLHP